MGWPYASRASNFACCPWPLLSGAGRQHHCHWGLLGCTGDWQGGAPVHLFTPMTTHMDKVNKQNPSLFSVITEPRNCSAAWGRIINIRPYKSPYSHSRGHAKQQASGARATAGLMHPPVSLITPLYSLSVAAYRQNCFNTDSCTAAECQKQAECETSMCRIATEREGCRGVFSRPSGAAEAES